MHLQFSIILCSSLLALNNVECYKNHRGILPCFNIANQRYRHININIKQHYGGGHERCRRSTAIMSMMMMMSGTKNHNPTTAISTSGGNARLTKSRINNPSAGAGGGAGDANKNNNNARLMKVKMKEAQLVEKLLFDAVTKMNRRSNNKHQRKATTMPPSKLFPSVRQCVSSPLEN